MPVIYCIYILNTYVPSYFSNATDDIDVKFLVFYWRKNDGILENGEENIAALL